MMKRTLALFLTTLSANYLVAQQTDSASIGKITVGGYVDVYYGFDFNQPATSDRAYAISSPRHNEFNINLAYIDLKYQNDRVRARFMPGIGTYVNSNYAAEAGSLKNVLEANAGVKLSKRKEIWVDAGVMSSPYTTESAISRDQLMYTRSMGTEASPYYLSGVRLSAPLGPKLNGSLYLMNGWQQISDINKPISAGTQLEYKPTGKLLLNWNTYVGSEQSSINPHYGNRYFSDVYAVYNADGRFTFTTCFLAGLQEKKDTVANKKEYARWWQGNVIARYRFTEKLSLAGRIEYFEDLENVTFTPITTALGFSTWSTGLCLNIKVTENALFRMEGRHFFSDNKLYINNEGKEINNSNLLIANLTVWF